jgi:mannose-6-phosphate isomerase class I
MSTPIVKINTKRPACEKQTSCFSLNKLKITDKHVRKSDNFHVGIVILGEGIIKSGNESAYVKKGDKFLTFFKTKEVTYIASGVLEIVLTCRDPRLKQYG